MKGIKSVLISNNKVKYQFEIRRNITIVRGDSGTGKTTLYEMIAEYTRLKEKSGVQISAPCNCVALVDIDWKNQLRKTEDSIVFIDEGAEFLATKEFAEIIRNTDNYYVIFNRESLHELPYSVDEIYEIKSSGKFHRFVNIYNCDEHKIYSNPVKKPEQIILTEDQKAGFELFDEFC